ncbi:MAG: DUF1553 domain-containing protein [Planctomycetia bacterium]|nr:DUF1553 domain-containing protein [Planctomycetia bacterium]
MKDASTPAPQYDSNILPIFKAKCFRCHSGEGRKAELELSTHAGVLKGGESGPAVVAGKVDESLLYERVRGGEMPPDGKDPPAKEEIDLIRRWIEAGAPAGEDKSSSASAALNQHDVLPILFRRCTVCHGAGAREAGLDLRSKGGMLAGGKSGPAIVPGKPDESLVIKRIRAGEMPPLRRIVEVSIKPIEPSETEIIARWIAQGAPEVDVKPDVATADGDPLVTDEDRNFWSFRPPRQVNVPTAPTPEAVRNPIDAFILQKLAEKGLTLSPEADRAALIRRVCLDLVGLPPSPEEVLSFVADPDPAAYEKLVDRLLASPRYGEAWGRHWLDLAGYADSEGKREQDIRRTFAYRYRDYVIRSFNADKPYDRFLLEQIAGDELADVENAAEITPELADNLVATGFLRMAPDPTWYNLTNFVPDRLEVLADEIDVLGSSVMGLTMKCARCHSHKFDPIPQRDYYRLLAVFKGAFDEHDWLKPNWHPGLSSGQTAQRDMTLVATAERREWESQTASLQKQIDELRGAIEKQAQDVAQKIFEQRLAALPEAIREDVRAALDAPPDKRSAVQAYLAEKFEKTLRVPREQLPALDESFKKLSEEMQGRVSALEAHKKPEPKIRALWDRGQPSPTYIYRRGDYLSPGRLVGPGLPSVLTDGKTPCVVEPPWPGAKKTGRRLAFARWLVAPDHPLTARVMVNRLWHHHFGRGLVRTLDNFGKAGSPPSHGELLDWLAVEFVRQGFSIKAMHRLMVTSATYRQASAVLPEHERLDPDNVFLSRMPMRRLSAEQLYDTMLLVAEKLREAPFGPPDALAVRADGLAAAAPSPAGWRRSIYLEQQRKVVATHLEAFDFPQMNPNCIERRSSTVAPQALLLMNNSMVNELAEGFARRVQGEAGDDPVRKVERVYLLAYGRPPDGEERQTGVAALAQFAAEWLRQLPADTADRAVESSRRALATYCHAILNSAEFLYID